MYLQPGDVVWVKFPFVEQGILKSRPALVLSGTPLGPTGGLVWAAMITGAKKAAWPGDIKICDLPLAGLPIPSSIRMAKLATIESIGARHVGRVGSDELAAALDFARAALA